MKWNARSEHDLMFEFCITTVTGNYWWSFWIGGYMNDTNGKYYWVDGTEVGQSGYTNWGQNQGPNSIEIILVQVSA